jgi:cyclophilin family peptidyl-prolyl cis-trans isomerase
MRPALALVVVILVAIGIAALTSYWHPGGSLPPSEIPDTPPESSGAPSSPPKSAIPTDAAGRQAAFDKVKDGAVRATLVVEGRGTMTLELYPKAAPQTVAHFVALAKQGFYNGIKFHRVEPGFVVQGGDPETRDISKEEFSAHNVGTHGSGKSVPLEAQLPHVPNSIGLARSNDPGSGDSQFYINLKDNASLDGNYCVFGRVIEGTDVPARIQIGDKITRLSVP